MKLSMSLLASYLAAYDPECYIVADNRTITGVRFLSDGQQYSPAYVYLGPARDYFLDQRYADALLLVSDENQLIIHGRDSEELLNAVLAAFEYYNEIERQLYEAAVSHHSLDSMMRILGKLFPGCALVFDLEGRLIGLSHPEKIPQDNLMIDLKLGDHMNTQTLGQLIVDPEGRVSHDLTDRPQHLKLLGSNHLGFVNMYLSQEEERVGFIMISGNTENEILCGLALEKEVASYLVQAQEFTEANFGICSTHGMIESLLENQDIPKSGKARISHLLGDSQRCYVMVYRNRSIQNYTMYTLWRREIEDSHLPCLAVLHEDHAVLVTGSEYTEALIDLICSRYSKDRVQLGISMPLSDLSALHMAYQQALFALNRIESFGILYCRDLAADYMYKLMAADSMARAMLHPAIGMLQSYDEANRKELLPTLETYLACSCSQRMAADALHVHLNTLKYRLKRLTEVGDLDLEDPEERLYLRISLKILRENQNHA